MASAASAPRTSGTATARVSGMTGDGGRRSSESHGGSISAQSGSAAGGALGSLDCARRLERHIGRSDHALGAGDALLHGAVADEKGARDLLDREAGDDA